MRKKGVTISDIAEKTGYSKTTVSFAFNWPNRISADAVSKILQCAKELGYRSNVGQLGNENRYKTICMIIPDGGVAGSCPEWARSTMRVYRQCAERGFMLSLIDQRRMSDIHFARTCVVDAFMLFCPCEPDTFFLETARKRGIPVIGINLQPECGEEEMEARRVENAQYCANVIFDLILTKTVTEVENSKAFCLYEPNV
ncbi:MAG: LacI family DNA-binding transcriptional regulator [Spirochaetales bacterium]|nr:LacI family DNA-binding transcriptional regulator [Spirochaetales bacterium]